MVSQLFPFWQVGTFSSDFPLPRWESARQDLAGGCLVAAVAESFPIATWAHSHDTRRDFQSWQLTLSEAMHKLQAAPVSFQWDSSWLQGCVLKAKSPEGSRTMLWIYICPFRYSQAALEPRAPGLRFCSWKGKIRMNWETGENCQLCHQCAVRC